MRRVWWAVRIAVIVAASYCIFAPGGSYTLRNVRADGCDTADGCSKNAANNCYCPNVRLDGATGCTGCFVPNDTPGCGSCSGGRGQVEGGV